MQPVFNQFLTLNTPDFAGDLQVAARVGFTGVELALDTVAMLMGRGYGLQSMLGDLRAANLTAVAAGAIRFIPPQAADENAAMELEDRLYLMGEIFKKTGAGLCAVDPFVAENPEDLCLYPEAAFEKQFSDTLKSWCASYSYLHFGICPDADPSSLLLSVARAAALIRESGDRRLSLVLDAGRLDERALPEISALPVKMISHVRLGLDSDFNGEFIRVLKELGYDNSVALSSTVMGQGDNAENIAESFELLNAALQG